MLDTDPTRSLREQYDSAAPDYLWEEERQGGHCFRGDNEGRWHQGECCPLEEQDDDRAERREIQRAKLLTCLRR